MSAIKQIRPENYSGYNPPGLAKVVQTIKKKNFMVVNDFSLGGDAPKDFIKVYKFGRVKYQDTKNWIKYIAKTGHKWYPNESITEHLLNTIGVALGLHMSHSELAVISGQLRFLSEYFLQDQGQELVHGVDIFAGYVADRAFIEDIEHQKLAREFFTFQFTEKAIVFAFPEDQQEIMNDFVKLLVFDAIVGNNDRHFYNWGVVKSIDGVHKPYFSPIFDTARGLFWNDSEQKIVERINQKLQFEAYLNKYILNSYPKTGWEGESDLNHFELIKRVKLHNSNYADFIDDLLSKEKEKKVIDVIKTNFSLLLSVERLYIVTECLKSRFHQLRKSG